VLAQLRSLLSREKGTADKQGGRLVCLGINARLDETANRALEKALRGPLTLISFPREGAVCPQCGGTRL